jgi:hypothetical protein
MARKKKSVFKLEYTEVSLKVIDEKENFYLHTETFDDAMKEALELLDEEIILRMELTRISDKHVFFSFNNPIKEKQ